MSALAELLEIEQISKKPPGASDKSDKPPPEVNFGTFGTPSPGPFQKIEGLEARRLWLVRHEDGGLVSHSFTPPAALAEVWGFYPNALSVEPEEQDDQEAEEPPPPMELEALPDDRVTCRQCRHRAGARCLAAKRGGFSFRDRWYEPDMQRLHACFLFAPLADDPDQRDGTARWPSLGWMARQS